MKNINMVNLNDNRITSLPSNLLSSNLNLVDLAVERNQLTSLDNMKFGGHGDLLSLSLDGNQLKVRKAEGRKRPVSYGNAQYLS